MEKLGGGTVVWKKGGEVLALCRPRAATRGWGHWGLVRVKSPNRGQVKRFSQLVLED